MKRLNFGKNEALNRLDNNARVLKEASLASVIMTNEERFNEETPKKKSVFLLDESLTLESLRISKKLSFPFTVIRAEDGIWENLKEQCSCIQKTTKAGSSITIEGLFYHPHLGLSFRSNCLCQEKEHCLWMLHGSKYHLKK